MALTPDEAYERAQKIWGTQVKRYWPRAWGKHGGPVHGEWSVELHNGTHHTIDGNGHPDCHQECAECESQVCT